MAHGNRVLGGWLVSGVILLRAGATYNATTGTDYNDDGAFDDCSALLGGASVKTVSAAGLDKTQYLVPQSQAAAILREEGK